MKKRIICWLCLLVLCCSVFLPVGAEAAALETGRKCSLTLHYTRNGVNFSGVQAKIYRVAQAFSDGTFDLIPPFRSYPVNIHGVTSQTEWKDIAFTLSAYISANQVKPDFTKKTGEDGKAVFDNLPTGLYLVQEVRVDNNQGIYLFDEFMVYLPMTANGEFDYDVEAIPKCSDYTPKTEYSVLKLWKDEGFKDKRPKSIKVEILKDDVVQETVELSEKNNWSHKWYVPDGTGTWTVVELDVPQPYKVSIKEKETAFVITNTYPRPPQEAPKTGDTFPLRQCVLVMCLSGMLLMTMGILYKRKQA